MLLALVALVLGLMMVPAAMADDLGGTPGEANCAGKQVSAHAKADKGFKKSADRHVLTVKENMVIIRADCA